MQARGRFPEKISAGSETKHEASDERLRNTRPLEKRVRQWCVSLILASSTATVLVGKKQRPRNENNQERVWYPADPQKIPLEYARGRSLETLEKNALSAMYTLGQIVPPKKTSARSPSKRIPSNAKQHEPPTDSNSDPCCRAGKTHTGKTTPLHTYLAVTFRLILFVAPALWPRLLLASQPKPQAPDPPLTNQPDSSGLQKRKRDQHGPQTVPAAAAPPLLRRARGWGQLPFQDFLLPPQPPPPPLLWHA